MVIAAQMERGMSNQKREFPQLAVPVFCGLRLHAARVDDNVAQNKSAGFRVKQIRSVFFHSRKIGRCIKRNSGERQNIGYPVNTAKVSVQFPDLFVSDNRQGNLDVIRAFLEKENFPITLRAVTRMEKSNFSRLATSVISVTLLIILIRLYNLLDNRVPYNISGVQCNERNAFNAPSCKDPRRDVKS